MMKYYLCCTGHSTFLILFSCTRRSVKINDGIILSLKDPRHLRVFFEVFLGSAGLRHSSEW